MSVVIYVPDIPEFTAVIDAARALEHGRLHEPRQGYWQIESESTLTFERKPMKLGPALWNSLLSGGFRGRILEYGRDRLVIAGDDA